MRVVHRSSSSKQRWQYHLCFAHDSTYDRQYSSATTHWHVMLHCICRPNVSKWGLTNSSTRWPLTITVFRTLYLVLSVRASVCPIYLCVANYFAPPPAAPRSGKCDRLGTLNSGKSDSLWVIWTYKRVHRLAADGVSIWRHYHFTSHVNQNFEVTVYILLKTYPLVSRSQKPLRPHILLEVRVMWTYFVHLSWVQVLYVVVKSIFVWSVVIQV